MQEFPERRWRGATGCAGKALIGHAGFLESVLTLDVLVQSRHQLPNKNCSDDRFVRCLYARTRTTAFSPPRAFSFTTVMTAMIVRPCRFLVFVVQARCQCQPGFGRTRTFLALLTKKWNKHQRLERTLSKKKKERIGTLSIDSLSLSHTHSFRDSLSDFYNQNDRLLTDTTSIPS